MAVGRSQLSQPFLVKILPIGMLIHRYDPVKYTIDCRSIGTGATTNGGHV
jgi:hypothetical protein